MSELLILKNKLKTFYARYDIIIDYVLKFAFALLAFLFVNGMTGYNSKVSGIFITLLLAAVCTFLPGSVTALAACGLILFQFFGLSIEYAAITLAVLLILFLAYFIFSPKTSFVLLLVPLLFFIKIPYAVPVLVGLTAGIVGIVPAVFGTYLYFTLDFSSEFAVSAASFGEGDFIPRITFIIDNTILNKEMLVMCIVFAATIILVHIIKSFSLDHSWVIAIITGSIVEAILVVMSHIMLSLDFSMGMLILGTLVAIGAGMILHFFFFSVDYSRTERVQFEDDDYYYYVKAVPKFNVARTEVKVKKINSRKEEASKNYDFRDMYGHEAEGEEDWQKKKAYEQDVVELEEEE